MHSDSRLSVSVIIPTKNRPRDLQLTIETLLKQTRLPDELIVVDQSAQKSLTADVGIPVLYVHNPSLTGLTAARNVSMELAKGDIWLFLDDDVVLEQDFIEQVLAAYEPYVTGVSGIITNYAKPPLGRLAWNAIFVRGAFSDRRQPIYWSAQHLRDGKPIRVDQFTGALMSFRSSAIKNLRFDPKLTGGCPGEDTEFCARIPKPNVLLIAPRARLVHNRSPLGRDSSHWLLLHAQVSRYMRERHWKHGLFNNLCYVWLNVGYLVAGAASSLRRASLEPLRAWQTGLQRGATIATGNSPR